ncbi:MAG: hypothetical protein LBD50_01320 [Rickettsiales bacterium]|jgi:hypothetical protein|nr:hypothetical protein [Rickettsiales bacterium]
MLKVLIAVPTFENIEPDCFKSLWFLHHLENSCIYFDFVRGYDCARARNQIAQRAIGDEFDYVLMTDSDNILPCDALVKLFAAGKDIILGWYPRKFSSSGQTELFRMSETDYTNETNISISQLPEDMVMEIRGGGMGCALIKTDVFRAMPTKTWFRYINYDNGYVLSEDLFFCDEARKAGYKIFCHTGVRCGHICKNII